MNKKFFIGVDSDGTAFNSMSIKHKNAFIPVFIETWGYSERREAVTQICERINLYSKTRGIDRFSGLLLTFDEIKRHGIETPDYRSLRGFLKCGALSNAGLREYIRQNKDDFLENVLLWSEAADKKFKYEVKDLMPFANVKKTLRKAFENADIAVISSASEESLKADWKKDGLSEYISRIFGQEFGKKSEQLRVYSDRYADGCKLMIGDAEGDLKAAQSAGAFFFPIIPGAEENSWEELYEVYLDVFFGGGFADFQQELNDKFYMSLTDERSK